MLQALPLLTVILLELQRFSVYLAPGYMLL